MKQIGMIFRAENKNKAGKGTSEVSVGVWFAGIEQQKKLL